MKEWLKVSRAANGHIVVTVTLAEDNLSAKWSARSARGQIEAAVQEGRKYALEIISSLREAVA